MKKINEEFIYLLHVMISVSHKVVNNELIFTFLWKVFATIYTVLFFSVRLRLSWKYGDARNFVLTPKSKFGLYQNLLTTPKTFSENFKLNLVELRQLPDIGKFDSVGEVFCSNWTNYNGKRKVCVNFKTDTDKLTSHIYRYRNNLHLRDNEVDLERSQYQLLLAKRAYLLGYTNELFKRRTVLEKTTVH